LKHVALSGDGEPTLCPLFSEVVQTVLHLRARGSEFFKVVLITNATGLDLPDVQLGLQFFTRHDEVWAKLDAGTEAYMREVNRTEVPLEKVFQNILLVGRQRPIIIQSLFAAIHGQGPSDAEILSYAQKLKELKEHGARISLVQIYSPTRPQSNCSHLPLRRLSEIARIVRTTAGLNAEVF
jgi:wyosine [tRNA(Phe)-imidazoG37] synthetase (radical SAM superfamily)